jgi:hypothetical protein
MRQGEEEVQLLIILDVVTRWGEWSASRPVRDLPPGKGPPAPIVQETGWATEPVWTQRLEEKSFSSLSTTSDFSAILNGEFSSYLYFPFKPA